MLFITLILLQYHIQSAVAYPLILPTSKELPSTILSPRTAALSKRYDFSFSSISTLTAIVVVVGVVIGVGVAMIAVCCFPWELWCTRSRPKEDKEDQIAVDETSRMMLDDTALRIPGPTASPLPSPRPSGANLRTPVILSTPLRYPGQYHGRGQSRGYETDDEQLNTRQEAKPTGYI